MKTPEEMAEEFSNKFVGERRKTIAKKSWYTGFEEGIKAAKGSVAIDTNSIDTGTKMQWISVKDRLPRPGQEVLVLDDKIMSVKAVSSYGCWHPYYNGCRCYPSHWMPLPEPPKEEK